MYKLDLEKAKEQEIRLAISVGSQKKEGNSRKTSASLTVLKPLTVWITTNWKIHKEMRIPHYLTCLLRNRYTSQEATIRTRHEQWTVSKLGKEYIKAVYCHPAYLKKDAEYIMQNAGLGEAHLESSLLGEISITSDTQMKPL